MHTIVRRPQGASRAPSKYYDLCLNGQPIALLWNEKGNVVVKLGTGKKQVRFEIAGRKVADLQPADVAAQVEAHAPQQEPVPAPKARPTASAQAPAAVRNRRAEQARWLLLTAQRLHTDAAYREAVVARADQRQLTN